MSNALMPLVDNYFYSTSSSYCLVPSDLLLNRAMLELNQILRANEINFAILAALPAFFVSLLLIMLVRAWVKKVI